MPARHISSQSFDDILSDLGDDPAIPDPHGIRKSSAPRHPEPEPPTRLKQAIFTSSGAHLTGLKIAPSLVLGGIFILMIGALFMVIESHKEALNGEIEGLQNQLLGIRKELTSLQGNIDQDQDDLYQAIDELEVSIHSLNTRPAIEPTKSRPTALPEEVELRSWRYLGLIRINGSEQAFFHTKKAAKMLAKDDLALGEWRLAQAQKEGATLIHPKGKSIHLKSAKSE
ncbi:MAG: hypothetical protein RL517_1304 [Pseudomonadota bacterium]